MTAPGSKPHLRSLAAPVARDRGETCEGPALSGSLDVVPIFDVVQWVCTARQSWLVRLQTGGIEGQAAIVEGQLVDARWGNQIGHEALTSILNARSGRFELQPISGEVQRSLRGNWILTLLTAAQKADEHSQIENCTDIDERRPEPLETPRRPHSSTPPRASGSGEYSFDKCLRQGRQRCGAVGEEPGALEAQKIDRGEGLTAAERLGFVESPTETVATSHLIDLGFLAMKSGERERARALWTQALAQDPDNRTLQFNLRKLDSLLPPAK